jgi:hypothetical protein
MAYCRFSPTSDVYCYEDVSGGWTTHVAGVRYVDFGKGAPRFSKSVMKKVRLLKKYARKLKQYRDNTKLLRIDLPYAGEHFNDGTVQEARDRLLWLKELGYCVPKFAIERMNDEIAEGLKEEMSETSPAPTTSS